MLTFIKEHILTILIVLNYIIAISAAFTILLKNINPTKTLSYIIVLVFFPFLGILVYYLFGQEYRKNKIFNRKHILNRSLIKKINKDLELNEQELKEVDQTLEEKIKLVKLLHKSENAPLTLHNDVEILINGNKKFEALLKDLKQAENHIHLEYYILKDDKIGGQIIDILCEKAKQGVAVRLSVDDVGSKISSESKKRLKNSGVSFYPFMPVLFPKFTGKMNYRNHRKIAIIDGLIGYLGGINISDNYVNCENDALFWRDTHIRIQGEAVKLLQIHFLTTWDFVSGSDIQVSKQFFPESKTKKETKVQIAASGPDTDWANIMEAILTAINTADNYIYITTPYFIPNQQIITALQIASRSGVDVRIIIPKKSDSWIANHATNSYLQSLMEAGVKVYRYTKGFVHAKTQVVDDIFTSIGTANLDYRSFNINFEINALIYNEAVSKQLKKQFLEDIKDSQEIELKRWEQRPKLMKLKESYSRLWAPLL
ncbi:cardiolipin synthase [Corallibacter sp.]|uniref:cardiolipin synthase n=1 Tax=Corallibacter sp. TaxID=2038084 RepID=UPI003AB68076